MHQEKLDKISSNVKLTYASASLDTSISLSHIGDMYRIETTDVFDAWLDNLRDRRAQQKIAQRLVRIEAGLLGDWKSVGDGVSEVRVDYGPGYRLYYTIREQVVVFLLCGSDKRDQRAAIVQAKALAKQI